MAITAPTTIASDFSGLLNPEQSAPIFERAARESVVQRLGTRVPLGANGVAIPVVTGKPQASWVSEGGQKPVEKGSMALRTIKPQKLATIMVVSAEVVRANPGGFMEVMRGKVGESFAAAFDDATLHGTATPFATFVDETSKSVELGTTAQAGGGVYGDLVAGMKLLVDDGKRLSGFAFDDRAEPVLLAGTDTTGRPLFIDSPLEETTSVVRPGRLIGRPAYLGEGVKGASTSLGYGGDWTQVAWGVVGGIAYKVSTEATVTINGVLTSLFEHNLVAVLAEAEYGFVCNDTAAFVKYVNAVA